jgi:hypothetical protein
MVASKTRLLAAGLLGLAIVPALTGCGPSDAGTVRVGQAEDRPAKTPEATNAGAAPAAEASRAGGRQPGRGQGR